MRSLLTTALLVTLLMQSTYADLGILETIGSALLSPLLPKQQIRKETSSDLSKLTRNHDGFKNNEKNLYWGWAGAEVPLLTTTVFADFLGLKLVDRGNPRKLSNIIGHVDDNEEIPHNVNGLTMFFTLFGQFLDHDLDFVKPSILFKSPIDVPKGDFLFDKNGKGGKIIPFARSVALPKLVNNTLGWVNTVTSYMDGSQLYGSDGIKASMLRQNRGGRLKMSNKMLIKDPLNNNVFLAGDHRTNENMGLTSIITMFYREHNRQCGLIAQKFPSMSDEQIYTMARNRVIGIIQKIAFKDWLPVLLGEKAFNKFVGEYQGYDANTKPTINLEFLTAGFRWGHSMIYDHIDLYNLNNQKIGPVTVKDMFQAQKHLKSPQDIEITLNGLMRSPTKQRSHQIVNSLRNMIVEVPNMVLDLFATNIQRGRDHGMLDYNTVRSMLGFPKLQAIEQISTNAETVKRLNEAYNGDVNNIDLWVGIICEESVQGGNLGPVGAKIVGETFRRVRAGDRLWYENAYPQEEIDQIEKTSIRDLVMRNTELTDVPEVFVMPDFVKAAATVVQEPAAQPQAQITVSGANGASNKGSSLTWDQVLGSKNPGNVLSSNINNAVKNGLTWDTLLKPKI